MSLPSCQFRSQSSLALKNHKLSKSLALLMRIRVVETMTLTLAEVAVLTDPDDAPPGAVTLLERVMHPADAEATVATAMIVVIETLVVGNTGAVTMLLVPTVQPIRSPKVLLAALPFSQHLSLSRMDREEKRLFTTANILRFSTLTPQP